MCKFFKALAKLFTIISPARLGYQRRTKLQHVYPHHNAFASRLFAKMSDGQLTTLKNHVAEYFIFLSQEPIGQLISARENP